MIDHPPENKAMPAPRSGGSPATLSAAARRALAEFDAESGRPTGGVDVVAAVESSHIPPPAPAPASARRRIGTGACPRCGAWGDIYAEGSGEGRTRTYEKCRCPRMPPR